MNCFNHPSSIAIGCCKACCKGLCNDCATDTGNGLACLNKCEKEVLEVNEMWERGKKIYGIGKYQSKIPQSGVLIWLVFSIVMWGITIFSYFRNDHLDISTLAIAILFTIVLGIAWYSSKRTGLNC